MTKEANFYGLNMLSIYLEMSEGQLNASLDQLENLKKAKTKPHVLDKAILERIIKLHESQNADNWVFFEQCKQWRNDSPNEEQLRLITRVENSIAKLEAVNKDILALAESFKGKTMDDIMAKDDFEVGLDWLLKNLSKGFSE